MGDGSRMLTTRTLPVAEGNLALAAKSIGRLESPGRLYSSSFSSACE